MSPSAPNSHSTPMSLRMSTSGISPPNAESTGPNGMTVKPIVAATPARIGASQKRNLSTNGGM